MSNLSKYLQDTVSEMKQVSWPTQQQAFLYTVIVILISVVVALFLGAFDFLFSSAVNFIINRV